MKRRIYRLSRRAETVAETRRRVVDAAAALFLDADFHQVSLDEVAARAGVGRTTVFQQFGSKAGLLRAVEEAVSVRAGVGALLEELSEPDALAALRAAFEVGCRVWATERLMFRKLFGLAIVDPDMREVMAQKEDGRRQLVDHLVKRLQRQRRLRPRMQARKAADLLWLLTSFESFDALYSRRPDAGAVAAMLLELTAVFVLIDP